MSNLEARVFLGACNEITSAPSGSKTKAITTNEGVHKLRHRKPGGGHVSTKIRRKILGDEEEVLI